MNDAAPAIKNVFVLMLENHSFDNIFAMSGIRGFGPPPLKPLIGIAGKSIS